MTEPTIIGTSTLYNGDCLEAMRQMPDNAFSLAIVDPPYKVNMSGGKAPKNGFTSHAGQWDKMKEWDHTRPSKEYFTQLARVSKNQIVWGANYYPEHLTPSMGWVFWYKMQDNFSFSDGEFAYTSFDVKARVVNLHRRKRADVAGGAALANIHPTQKPVELYKWLLKHYAKEGDTILDTHLGSGSHAIACNDMGFNLTAYEIDADYFKAACERIDNAAKQYKLAL